MKKGDDKITAYLKAEEGMEKKFYIETVACKKRKKSTPPSCPEERV